MCGISGIFDLRGERPMDGDVVRRMAERLHHRGPDAGGLFLAPGVGFGFRRLSIIDLDHGHQPIANEDESCVMMCNGEIFNHKALRAELEAKGHRFRTHSDVEVIVHLYEEHGPDLVERLNGQFALAIVDRRRRQLVLARDQFGIAPLYYTEVDGQLLFGSEVKALLEHPAVSAELDPRGVDQILSFPGLVSPQTMFRGVRSLAPGHLLVAQGGEVQVREYWDLDYPRDGELTHARSEREYVEGLVERLEQSVRYRLQADVPVGFYLSGGLDSSLIGALIHRVSPDVVRSSFSISFADKEKDERRYQQMFIDSLPVDHHDIRFDWAEIAERMFAMVEHCECAVKESYNTCSLALSEAVRRSGLKVVLTGEGSDELFAGYVGYRFDGAGRPGGQVEDVLEAEMRRRLWGDAGTFYEKQQHAFREVKRALFSDELNARYFEEVDCLERSPVNPDRLRGRHPLHQRSYLDFKLRLADHLVADHGDRMALANSVEARYPFLDVDLIDYVRLIPPGLKLRGMTEKYILKQAARGLVPDAIIDREKFGFHAPGSPALLQAKVPWALDLLSPARLRRQGVFNAEVVDHLVQRYSSPGFRLRLPFEDDLLMIVLTTQMWMQLFEGRSTGRCHG